jgi:hypothetical protein
MEDAMRPVRTIALCATIILFSVAASPAGDHVRLKGRDFGTFSATPTSDPQVVLTQDSASGEATTFGRYTLVAHEFINLATLTVQGGAFTMTAANGDTLMGEYSGQAAAEFPTIIHYDVSGPITGGTGRFAGATGIITFDGFADLQTGLLTDRVIGTISQRDSQD